MASVVERTKVHPGTAEFEDVSDCRYTSCWGGRRAFSTERTAPVSPCLVFNAKNVALGKKLQVVSIERVRNSALEQRFKDKTQEYKQAFGQVRIVKAWHGTKKLNVAPILKNNFDVSKHSQGVGESTVSKLFQFTQ